MKMGLIALLGLCLLSGAAQGAGVRKINRATVNETLLQGYVVTPPAGWAPSFSYFVAAPATEPVQKIAVISSQTRTGAITGRPTPIGLTTISLATGAILTKDDLPAPAQLTAADCTAPFTNCQSPSLILVRPDVAIPSRLLVTVLRLAFSATPTYKVVTYAFDPAAAVGSADRWTLVETTTGLTVIGFGGIGATLGGGTPDQKLYNFLRISATATRVFEVVNK